MKSSPTVERPPKREVSKTNGANGTRKSGSQNGTKRGGNGTAPMMPVRQSCPKESNRRNLLDIPLINSLIKRRGFQFAVQVPNVLVYILVILTGLYGIQDGGKNFATVITWIIWWAGIIFTIVFAGRLWCFMCPFSAVAEWIQRMAWWRVRPNGFGLGLKWPRRLRNFYVAIAFFLVLTWVDHQFDLVGSPMRTAYFVIVILAAAIIAAMLFERRTFCRYICPIGGLIGMYSLFSGAELRVKDRAVCRDHKEKNCVIGRAGHGYGCPVMEYPGNMESNTYCTLCTECVKTCPKNNIAINVRPFAADLVNMKEKGLRLDVVALAVVLLSLPTFQTLIMIAPWEGWMNTLSDLTGLSTSVLFTLTFLVGGLAIPLALYYVITGVSHLLARREGVTHQGVAVNMAFALIPIGLMMHLAHNVKHLLGEGQIAIPVISDPFGKGWNLFGTAGMNPSAPFSMSTLTMIQFVLVVVGQAFAVYVAYRRGRQMVQNQGRVLATILPILVLTVAWSVLNLVVLNAPMDPRH